MAGPAATRWASVLGLLIVAGLAALDAAWGPDRIIIASVVIAPFVTALRGTVRQTALVAGAAVAACAVSAAWNHNLGDPDYAVRLVVVGAGAGFAILSARSHERLRLDRIRFRVLSGVAELGDTTRTVDETVRAVNDLLVPEYADVCVIEVLRDGATERLAVATRTPPGDLAALGPGSRITVELRARGRRIGALTVAATEGSRRRYASGDRDFAAVLAGRVALALDNARLSSELASLEAMLTAALSGLAEAVTIQERDGRLVYANEAAARSLGFDSPEQLLSTPASHIIDEFDSYLEDGSPLQLDDLPGRRVLSGQEPRPLLIRVLHRATGEERWRLTKATAVLGADGQPRLAVNVIEDVTDVKRAEMAQRFLAEAGAVLSSSLDYEETLARVARLAVPQLADWCAVTLPDDQGLLRTVAVAHADPDKVQLAADYNRRYAARLNDAGGSGQVMRDGVAQVVNEIPDEMLSAAVSDPEQLAVLRSLGMRAVMLVPMVAPGGVSGVISFVSAESGRPFTAADLEAAEELGRRAGAAVDNARLYTERSRIAQTLQLGLLPDELPRIPRFEVASLYRPAGEETFVGGDFYDAFVTGGGWMLVVGDVTGRGAEAAALTAQARHTLRTAGTLLGDPIAAIEQLNRALAGQPDLPICTVAVVLLADREESTVATIACAGHPQPLLVRGEEVWPVGATGPMVGAWPDSRWSADTVELESDDVLVLYTDGVIDAVGGDGRFNEDRLVATLRGAQDAGDAVVRIQQALKAFERGPQADDTAVVAVHRLPAPVESPTIRAPGARASDG